LDARDRRMSNYVPHYTKKLQILARKEQHLRRLIGSGATPRRLIAAAEVVRASRVRALRAKRATIIPKGDAVERFARIDAKIQGALGTPISAILVEFGYPSDGETEDVAE
jgi:hypothetical protein